jgi:hypothetical protein
MKILFPHAQRVLVAGLAAASFAFLSGCSTTGAQAVSNQTLGRSSQSGVDARTIEHGNSLCVTGTVRRPFGHALPPGAHVDIQLLDASGRVIAASQDGIVPAYPRVERRRAGRYSFTACFPRPVGDGWTVHVSYHADAHS